MSVLRAFFGAKGQIAVGVVFVVLALAQWAFALAHLDNQPLLVRLLVHVSMEALVFAAYAIIATGLGYRATERVETAVVENIENADTVVGD